MKEKKAHRADSTSLERFRGVAEVFPGGSKAAQSLALHLLAAGIPGAERAVLDLLARETIDSQPIDPLFQSVANAIIAKAAISGKLPPTAKGRPRDLDQAIGWDVTCEYFEMVDSGTRYIDAVTLLAEKFNKSERRIMQLVASERSKLGKTKVQRAFTLAAWRHLRESGVDLTLEPLESSDPQQVLEEMVVDLLANRTDPWALLRKAQADWIKAILPSDLHPSE